MDSEDRKLLEETHRLAEENNQLLHKVRGVQKRATIWTAIKIFVIVGIALGSFYFLEPYIDRLMDIYSSIMKTEQDLRSGSFFQRN